MTYRNSLLIGDSIAILKQLPDNYVDSIVTDPPYELGFMGKDWDNLGIAYNADMWRECLRVLKPGGHLLSFGAPRTQHRMACAIEDAGFEIRDQIMWIFSTGFPKSYNVAKGIESLLTTGSSNTKDYKKLNKKNVRTESTGFHKMHFEQGDRPADYGDNIKFDLDATTPEAKQWEGWGTSLKPAHESIICARKPLREKTVAENVLKWGTGGINIDECRIETTDKLSFGSREIGDGIKYGKCKPTTEGKQNPKGRFPSNIIFDEEAGKMLDEQTGVLTSGKSNGFKGDYTANIYGKYANNVINPETVYGDSGGASRFFYCAKSSKKERGEGNNHPTVKPIDLIKYLIKLVTPSEGIVLDPFAGSGTTALAAVQLSASFILIEKQLEYAEIAMNRIKNETGVELQVFEDDTSEVACTEVGGCD